MMTQAEREREKSLYLYTSALDRGDFEAVASILARAEEDSVLERLILEVNDALRAEVGLPPAAWERRQDRVERSRQAPGRANAGRPWTNRAWVRTGLAVAGAAVALILVLSVAWLAYSGTATGLPESLPSLRADMDDAGSGEGLSGYGGDTAGRRGLAPDAELPPAPPMEAPAAEEEQAPGGQPAGERLIIRNGSLLLVVEDPRAAQAAVEQMVAGMAGEGAYVVSSQEYGTGREDELPTVQMYIRIPAARFDEAMDRLADLAVRVDNRTQSGEDVTEEYVDLEARVESLEAARDRLLALMQDAQTTEDLLLAEQQLTQRESEIEAMKGRLQYLSEAARLASISLELQPYVLNQPVSTTWRPSETVRAAIEALIDGLRKLGDFVIFFAIAILPWLLVAGLVLYVVVRLVRRGRRGRARAG